ncbi:MAG: PfkB family carbohydrate kinase [Anaerolineae bacterium]
MGILVVGSVALDNIETPSGQRKRCLGGACTFFSVAASLYDKVSMVGVVGEDFPREHLDYLAQRNIDICGLQIQNGSTFSWSARYGQDLDTAETLDTQLNVFADFHPVIPQALRTIPYIFLANIDPDLQIEVLKQMTAPHLKVLDSMNYWITSKREALTRAMSLVDVIILNEAEVKQYTQEANLFSAAEKLLALGPRVLVVKKGQHGSMLTTRLSSGELAYFQAPAYPLAHVIDPTGAGDTFAAGFVGYLARTGDLSQVGFRRAVIHGTVMASFKIEDFSIDRLRTLTVNEIELRYKQMRSITYFENMAEPELDLFQQPVI